MATCLQTIADVMAGPGIDSLTVINPNTNTPIVVTPSANQLLLARMQVQQTVTFTVTLSSSIPGSFNVSLTIYQVVGSTVSSYASINLTTASTTFQKDFQSGTYIFCFHGNNTASYTGNIIGSFISVPSSAILFPVFKVGEKVKADLTIPSPPRVCSQVMFYEVTAGEVPPGVYLDELGTLRGQLPNLDCMPPDQFGYTYSPSFNWFYERSGISYPLGRQWRFKVKLSLAANPEVFIEDWFCIRVYNNWDFDRDNFIAQAPFDHETEVAEEIPPPVLEPLCEDCPEPEAKKDPVALQQICVPCDSPPETSMVTLIEIPEPLRALPPSQFTQWYAVNNETDFSKSCPEIQKFINDLKGSTIFNKLLEQNSLAPSTELTEQELFIATTYKNFLQIASTRLTNGRNPTDIDTQLFQWQFQENQANPLFSDVYSGETIPPFELEFSRHD